MPVTGLEFSAKSDETALGFGLAEFQFGGNMQPNVRWNTAAFLHGDC